MRKPSSPPEARKGSLAFQSMTLTSEECAEETVTMQARSGRARESQMRTVLSTELET